MSPHYNRYSVASGATVAKTEFGASTDDDAMDLAAEALRHAEVQAVWTGESQNAPADLESLPVDPLRARGQA